MSDFLASNRKPVPEMAGSIGCAPHLQNGIAADSRLRYERPGHQSSNKAIDTFRQASVYDDKGWVAVAGQCPQSLCRSMSSIKKKFLQHVQFGPTCLTKAIIQHVRPQQLMGGGGGSTNAVQTKLWAKDAHLCRSVVYLISRNFCSTCCSSGCLIFVSVQICTSWIWQCVHFTKYANSQKWFF